MSPGCTEYFSCHIATSWESQPVRVTAIGWVVWILIVPYEIWLLEGIPRIPNHQWTILKISGFNDLGNFHPYLGEAVQFDICFIIYTICQLGSNHHEAARCPQTPARSLLSLNPWCSSRPVPRQGHCHCEWRLRELHWFDYIWLDPTRPLSEVHHLTFDYVDFKKGFRFGGSSIGWFYIHDMYYTQYLYTYIYHIVSMYSMLKRCDTSFRFYLKLPEHDNDDCYTASVFMFAMQQLHRGCLSIFLRFFDLLSRLWK